MIDSDIKQLSLFEEPKEPIEQTSMEMVVPDYSLMSPDDAKKMKEIIEEYSKTIDMSEPDIEDKLELENILDKFLNHEKRAIVGNNLYALTKQIDPHVLRDNTRDRQLYYKAMNMVMGIEEINKGLESTERKQLK